MGITGASQFQLSGFAVLADRLSHYEFFLELETLDESAFLFCLVLPPLALPPLPHAVDHVGQQLPVVHLVILK